MHVKILTNKALSSLLLCLLSGFGLQQAVANGFEDLNHIKSSAEQFALAQLINTNLSEIQAKAVSMDARLQLVKCEQELETFSTSNTQNLQRTTVGVRCNGVKPWTLYVPVTITAQAEVIYTVKAKVRGEMLSIEDVELKRVPLQQLPANYLSDIADLKDMELTRSLKTGSILTLNTLKVRQIVQRGQEVIILAKGNNVQVRMSGVALKNGGSGDIIPIRNIKSGRTIEATILDDTTVIVNM